MGLWKDGRFRCCGACQERHVAPGVITVFVAVNASLVALKRRQPAPPGVSTVPIAVPAVGAALSVAVLVGKAVTSWLG